MNQLRRNNRKHMRLKGYDYSQAGLYFITICTKNREHIFGIINNGVIILNEYGDIVRNYWNDIPNHYNNVELDQYIIMTNHFHGIIRINPPVGAQFIASNITQFIASNTTSNITSNNQITIDNRSTSNNPNIPDNKIIPENQNIIKPKPISIVGAQFIAPTNNKTTGNQIINKHPY